MILCAFLATSLTSKQAQTATQMMISYHKLREICAFDQGYTHLNTCNPGISCVSWYSHYLLQVNCDKKAKTGDIMCTGENAMYMSTKKNTLSNQ